LPVELRRATVPQAVRAWVARETGSTVQRARRLPGASSTAVHRVDLASGARLVLRRYVWPAFLADEPDAPLRELDALRFAVRRRLPAPEVVAADVTGAQVGDGVPVLLMTLLPGRAVGVPVPDRLAEVAAAIHDVDPDGFAHDYFPWCQAATSSPPAPSTRPWLWEAAIEIWTDRMPTYRPSFVHRDFHPGNVLWSRGRPTGVVDWANACRGPWGCDIAHCRANLAGLAGLVAADRFLSAYESLTGRTYDPYWEIASVLESSPSQWTPSLLAEDEPRLERAVRTILARPTRRPSAFDNPRAHAHGKRRTTS
jgi:aminoglycoside phosphotransferase (APT) family kinase protein